MEKNLQDRLLRASPRVRNLEEQKLSHIAFDYSRFNIIEVNMSFEGPTPLIEHIWLKYSCSTKLVTISKGIKIKLYLNMFGQGFIHLKTPTLKEKKC